MSAKIKNSLSTFLEQAVVLTNNSMEVLDKINEAVVSNEDSVVLTITDPSNTDTSITYQIPSFGYLKNEIDRLEATLTTMSNVDGTSGSRLRLSDGSYRKIIASKVPSEAPTIKKVNNITTFEFKSNWFFEDMLNPMLYVTWDFTGQVPNETEKVMIQRYILECDTLKKIKVFDTNFKGKNDIKYKDFIYTLVNNGIRYSLDDEIKELPPRSKRYTGNFSVVKGEMEDSPTKVGKSMRYTLLDLKYTDSRADIMNTRILSVGDVVEVVSEPVTTRYKVTYVDVSANKIGLQCIEGFEAVKVGKDTLRISGTQDSTIKADIPIGYGEREVIFMKPIDPDSNMPAASWSAGVGFFTNELTYTDGSGEKKNLQTFYQKNVVDFGQILLSYNEDYYPTVREGIVPNPPKLNYSDGEGDFKIVQINSQLTEGTDTASFRELIASKSNILTAINNNYKEIERQKTLIQTTNFVDGIEKKNANDKLSSLITEQEQLNSNYTSLINTIKSKYTDTVDATPKYRVRGFWDIPEEKISPATGVQRIIKFKIRYRYLNKSGVANKEEEFTYGSNGLKVTGRFSNWNEIETKLRPRIKMGNKWTWEYIDTSNSEAVNINQLDIPIQKGEQVEIQVKSVSEAGFPSNPLQSEWSDPIVIAFSDFAELEADDITSLIKQNDADAAIQNVNSSFKAMNSHVASSFYANDTYYAHNAQVITSGFLTDEQKPITLYDKLQDLQNQITQIIEQINHTAGNLVVTLTTSDTTNTKKYVLTEKGVTYINAGNYTTEVSRMVNKKLGAAGKKNGMIVTKTFYLDITTDVQSGLYLLSKLGGNRNAMVPSSRKENITTVNEYNEFDSPMNYYEIYDNELNPSDTSSIYYKTKGRYDLVPINLTGANELIDYTKVCPNGYQSAQCKGQFVYSRFRDVSDTFDMYANTKLTDINGKEYGNFDESAPFADSEIYITSDSNGGDINLTDTAKKILYGESNASDIWKSELELYNKLSGSDLSDENVASSDILKTYPILYRLPKTWNKKPITYRTLLSEAPTSFKILKRMELNANSSNSTTPTVQNVNLSKMDNMTKKLAQRMVSTKNITGLSKSEVIIPKIQAAFGLSDWGVINQIDLDNEHSEDDGTYITTHKIGYLETDRYLNGEDTCNSYLFLSPINHEQIQVEGDTANSTAVIDSNDSIKVPIVYQYRMTDYNGNIFGKSGLKATDEKVKNTKFANIIGIDIWTDVSSDEPKQYDIVVYSTYGNSSIVDVTNSINTSTQTLVDATRNITTQLDSLVKQSTSTTIVKKNSNLKLKK
jgi:hypothetical protein